MWTPILFKQSALSVPQEPFGKGLPLCEEFQKDKPRTHRMTRHFYDLEKLMHTPYAEMALKM